MAGQRAERTYGVGPCGGCGVRIPPGGSRRLAKLCANVAMSKADIAFVTAR